MDDLFRERNVYPLFFVHKNICNFKDYIKFLPTREMPQDSIQLNRRFAAFKDMDDHIPGLSPPETGGMAKHTLIPAPHLENR